MRKFIKVQGKCYLVKDGKVLSWPSASLKEEYGRSFVENLESYDTFFVKPSNTEYEPVVNNEWNLYNKIVHDVKEGPFPLIKALIEHIFYEDVRMGMEYLWNIWNKPLQQLPGLGLVSVKKGTGKSTFLDLIQLMIQGNAVAIDHGDLVGDFNAAWAGKLAVLIDEKPEGKLVNKELQKLKKLITSHTVMYKQKYVSDTQMPNFSKFIFASNDRKNIMKIEPENTRFWIIDVPPLDTPDHDIYVKMKKEMGCFIHYIQNVFEARPARGRVYFADSELQTEATKYVQENSRSQVHEEILNLLEQSAMSKRVMPVLDGSGTITKWRNDQIILATPHDIKTALGQRTLSIKYIKDVIQDELRAVRVAKQVRYANTFSEGTKGFPYIFKYELTEDDFKFIPNYNPPDNIAGPAKRKAKRIKQDVIPLKIEFRDLKEN